LKIKICGLFRREDILSANEARPDYVGFVFAKSRRQVTLEQAVGFRRLLEREIPAVGVFRNAPVDEVVSAVQSGAVSIVQLHGGEDREYIGQVKSRAGVPVIRSVVMDREDPALADTLGADFLLLDSGAGSGRTFDWSRIPPLATPYFLAGGIGEENIRDAVRTGAWGIDVSSGAERDGVKDADRMRALVAAVRKG